VDGAHPAARTPVHRRRPEAVDLPVPPRRHRAVPARRRPDRRHARPPHRQLPLVRTGDPVGQPRVRPGHHVPGGRPTRLPPARCVPAAPPHARVGAPARRRGTRRPRAATLQRRRAPVTGSRRRRRCRRHRPAAAVAGGRRRGRRPPAPCVPPRRHHDPAPRPHITPGVGGRPHRTRHPVPRREQLGRLHHHRDPTRDAGPARGRRPDERAGPDRRAPDRPVRLQRRRAVRVAATRRVVVALARTARRPGRPPGRRCDRARALDRRARRVVGPRRPRRRPRRRAPAARRRPRPPRRPRRVASHPLRRGAGTRLVRRRRPRATAVPRLGAAAGVGGAHRRHHPARARPRRGADHDHSTLRRGSSSRSRS
jgi:hypothetical protein